MKNDLSIIKNEYSSNKLAHVFLIKSNNINETYLKLKEILFDIIKETNNISNLKELINNESLPDIIKISTEELQIKKEQILELEDRLSTKPSFINCKYYIILEAEKLNLSSSNSMLKFIEEPSDNIVGFLITNNLDRIPPTIKSRCQIIRLNDLINCDVNCITQKIAEIIFDAIVNKSSIVDLKIQQKSRVIKRSDWINTMNYLKTIVDNSFLNNQIKAKIDKEIIDFICKCNYNTNIDLLVDSFYIKVGEII